MLEQIILAQPADAIAGRFVVATLWRKSAPEGDGETFTQRVVWRGTSGTLIESVDVQVVIEPHKFGARTFTEFPVLRFEGPALYEFAVQVKDDGEYHDVGSAKLRVGVQ